MDPGKPADVPRDDAVHGKENRRGRQPVTFPQRTSVADPVRPVPDGVAGRHLDVGLRPGDGTTHAAAKRREGLVRQRREARIALQERHGAVDGALAGLPGGGLLRLRPLGGLGETTALARGPVGLHALADGTPGRGAHPPPPRGRTPVGRAGERQSKRTDLPVNATSLRLQTVERLAKRHASAIAVRAGFDEPLAHLVEAGADMFLMPSRFEPCGLNQMYSLRYGTIPVVRAVGGLEDTVEDFDGWSRGTGFKFRDYHPHAMMLAVRRALEAFRDRRAWRAMMLRGMAQDFSWDRSAQSYEAVYRTLARA